MIEGAKRLPPFRPELRAAIREGRKTQTRRVVKPQPDYRHDVVMQGRGTSMHGNDWRFGISGICKSTDWDDEWVSCPYGRPGDVRFLTEPLIDVGGVAAYRDSDPMYSDAFAGTYVLVDGKVMPWRWQNPYLTSIYMPNEAARTFVRIVSVRVERVTEITRSDIRAEGVTIPPHMSNEESYKRAYLNAWVSLWDSINGERDGGKYAWDKAPWVWVIEWEPIESTTTSKGTHE